ncbi:MAG: bifunctional riboflavin kinase/FAD synthetase [Gammaproteobacteria bacterium]|nr:bifunctional riboflavin kinase/FAD synthetase [Gammaproteobacteria bacterium]
MELIRGLHNLRPRHRGCAATIGAFDGVHHGHRAVLGHLLEKSAELGVPSVVVVFEPLPREYFSPTQAPARLMSFREKFRALEALGVDRVLRIRFDENLQTMSAQAFITQIFVEGLGVRYIVVGDDLHFGHGREGDYWMMKAAGERYGFQTMHTATLGVSGTRVSSTRIREALGNADFMLAEELLGRPYSVTGKVVYGEQLGRSLGVPTANLELQRLRFPLSGVYIVEVAGVAATPLPGVANVGTRPTVDDSIRANLEVHLLDFDRDIYGRTISVTFREKIREEQKFDSLDELKQQLYRDIARGREFFGYE